MARPGRPHSTRPVDQLAEPCRRHAGRGRIPLADDARARRFRHGHDLRRACAGQRPGLPGQLGVWSDAHLPGLTRLARHPRRRQRVQPAAAAFGPAVRHRAHQPGRRRTLGRCRDRSPRTEYRRGGTTGAGLRRRGAPRRTGRLPGRGTATARAATCWRSFWMPNTTGAMTATAAASTTAAASCSKSSTASAAPPGRNSSWACGCRPSASTSA